MCSVLPRPQFPTKCTGPFLPRDISEIINPDTVNLLFIWMMGTSFGCRRFHVSSSSLDSDKEVEAGDPESSHHPRQSNLQQLGVASQRTVQQNRPASVRAACDVGGEVCLHLYASAGPELCLLQGGGEVCGESTSAGSGRRSDHLH